MDQFDYIVVLQGLCNCELYISNKYVKELLGILVKTGPLSIENILIFQLCLP